MGEKLTRRTKFLYGVGDTSFSLSLTILNVYFAIFLTDVVGIPPALVAGALFIGRSWDYINDPVIGFLSDRTRSRWGRRRPYLLFGAVPFVAAFMLLWVRPPWQDPAVLMAYYALAYILFDTAASFVYMPYMALTPELSPDYDERTSLTSYRMFFSILGSLVAFTLPLIVIGELVPENAGRVFSMGIIFGLICLAPLWMTFLEPGSAKSSCS